MVLLSLILKISEQSCVCFVEDNFIFISVAPLAQDYVCRHSTWATAWPPAARPPPPAKLRQGKALSEDFCFMYCLNTTFSFCFLTHQCIRCSTDVFGGCRGDSVRAGFWLRWATGHCSHPSSLLHLPLSGSGHQLPPFPGLTDTPDTRGRP